MAKLSLQFHPDARDEALRAYDWYAARSPSAAEAFAQELEIAGQSIAEQPELWSSYLYETRRYLLRRFPFLIVYRVAADRIEVVAVAHGRRSPGYWSERLEAPHDR